MGKAYMWGNIPKMQLLPCISPIIWGNAPYYRKENLYSDFQSFLQLAAWPASLLGTC
jgi:hypothetical protein